MISMLAALTLFFFCASFVQLYYLHGRIEKSPKLDLSTALDRYSGEQKTTSVKDRLDFTRWRTLATLEGYAIAHRYHQANVSLMSRIWVRYLGFVTGMILALVGAAFILGKLREPEATLEAKVTTEAGFSIASTSPGLILAVLGTALMVTTILARQPMEIKDTSLYMSLWPDRIMIQGAAAGLPAPEPYTPSSDKEILEPVERALGVVGAPTTGSAEGTVR